MTMTIKYFQERGLELQSPFCYSDVRGKLVAILTLLTPHILTLSEEREAHGWQSSFLGCLDFEKNELLIIIHRMLSPPRKLWRLSVQMANLFKVKMDHWFLNLRISRNWPLDDIYHRSFHMYLKTGRLSWTCLISKKNIRKLTIFWHWTNHFQY